MNKYCCDQKLLYLSCFDNGSKGRDGYCAYNLYVCDLCGKIYKENVGSKPHVLIIESDSTIRIEGIKK